MQLSLLDTGLVTTNPRNWPFYLKKIRLTDPVGVECNFSIFTSIFHVKIIETSFPWFRRLRGRRQTTAFGSVCFQIDQTSRTALWDGVFRAGPRDRSEIRRFAYTSYRFETFLYIVQANWLSTYTETKHRPFLVPVSRLLSAENAGRSWNGASHDDPVDTRHISDSDSVISRCVCDANTVL